MSSAGRPRPSLARLLDLYLRLAARVEKLDGAVKQLLAERTRDTNLLPTWKGVQGLRGEIDRLRKKIDGLPK
jgi:hypothetical protein